MSSGVTANLGLHVYDTLDDFDYNEVTADNENLDLAVPVTYCTAATRPTTNLFVGRRIYETDTKIFYQRLGTAWVPYNTNDQLPAPVRGYMINVNKNVTATTWADVASDIVKAIVAPQEMMIDIKWRAQINGVAATALSVRLAWTGAISGDSYTQMDSGILGAVTSTETAKRDSNGLTLMVPAGTTTFKLQAQRGNTSNATSVDACALTITPLGWAWQFVPAAD